MDPQDFRKVHSDYVKAMMDTVLGGNFSSDYVAFFLDMCSRTEAFVKRMQTAYELNDGWQPDWSKDNKEGKYYLLFNSFNGCIEVDRATHYMREGIYYKSRRDAEIALLDDGETIVLQSLGITNANNALPSMFEMQNDHDDE